MTILDQFVASFGVWKEAQPYISMIVDEQLSTHLIAGTVDGLQKKKPKN
jgi:hypothetical protein